jgi:two-component system alkaline phosphatase synthesis response regulator PhoP
VNRDSAATTNGRDPVARILLVDDEPALLDAVGYTLRREGYTVDLIANGADALAVARSARPDLVVLDVMLPGMDGLQVCRALRAESTVPILLLSARGEEVDRVLGLELGADDYLTKPFAMRELLARVRAMLRRAGMAPSAGSGRDEDGAGPEVSAQPTAASGRRAVLIAGDLAIDPASRRATLRGEPLTLKPKEFDLLHYLARHPGIVLSRDALLRRVWGYDYPVDTRTVDVHVRWLRQKIEDDPARPRRIETVRGFGYRFAADPERQSA